MRFFWVDLRLVENDSARRFANVERPRKHKPILTLTLILVAILSALGCWQVFRMGSGYCLEGDLYAG